MRSDRETNRWVDQRLHSICNNHNVEKSILAKRKNQIVEYIRSREKYIFFWKSESRTPGQEEKLRTACTGN